MRCLLLGTTTAGAVAVGGRPAAASCFAPPGARLLAAADEVRQEQHRGTDGSAAGPDRESEHETLQETSARP